MVSPLMIEIAVHYHCMTSDYRNGDFSAPSVKGAVDSMVKLGFLKPNINSIPQYSATERLHVWVRGLCEVPFPISKWVMPE